MGSESGAKKIQGESHASTFSSTTTAATGTASITAITLCECTNTAADVVAEDAFVAGVGHDCFNLCLVFERKIGSK